jgi:hypothetical protein
LELLLKNMPEGAHEAQEEFKLKDNPPLDWKLNEEHPKYEMPVTQQRNLVEIC